MKTWFTVSLLNDLKEGKQVTNKFVSYDLISADPLVFKFGEQKYEATEVKMGKFVECKRLESETSPV